MRPTQEKMEVRNARIKDYEAKEKFLKERFKEVSPLNFYRDVFPVGSFERKGRTDDEKPNGLALVIDEENKGTHVLLTDELEKINSLIKEDFVILSAISYFGGKRTGTNARFLYAMVFDIDMVGYEQIRDIVHQARTEQTPMPTYIVNSGGGVHLYYLFDTPIPLFPKNQKYLKALKYALTTRLWNGYSSKKDDPEYQGILQGFRMVGSPSKLGKNMPVKAYKVGGRVSIDYLLEFIPYKEELGKLSNYRVSKYTLEEAKAKFPEWYKWKIEGEGKSRWHINRNLYDWFKRKMMIEAKVGHRYFIIMALAIYARKCDISEEELRADAYEVLRPLDALTEEEDNHFLREDIETALNAFNETYITFPRAEIEKLTGISIPPNKRNYRKQAVHLARARAVQKIDYPNGEWRYKGGGTPTKDKIIRAYLIEHPNATKKEIKDSLGVSYPTIRRYYDTIRAEIGVSEDEQ